MRKDDNFCKNRVKFFLQLFKDYIQKTYHVKTFVEQKNYINIAYKEVRNSTIIKNRDGEINLDDYRSFCTEENKCNYNDLYCNEVLEAIFDNLSNLAVKVIDEHPETRILIENSRETQRLISQFYTLSELTGKKIVHSNKFMEYFGNYSKN